MKKSQVEVIGIRTSYMQAGGGQPLLILHGWGWPISSPQWLGVKERLEKAGYTVFVPDLPGFGSEPSPTAPWGLDEYAEWVKTFCEEKGLARVFLLGHSFGGAVATKFSVAYPAFVEKLILVDSAGIRRKRMKKELQKKIAHFLHVFSFLPFYDFVRKVAYRTLFRHSDYLLQEGVMKQTYLKALTEDISGVFSRVSVPTVLLWGAEDTITPLGHAYFIKENILGATLEIIPGVKHNPHKEAPEALVGKIIESIA